MRSMLGVLFRTRLLSSDSLHHTEWTRRLGPTQLVTLASALSVPVMVFLLVPCTILYVTGPSILLALALAFIVFLLTGFHMIELSVALPKSCMTYHVTYATLGALPAFVLGWTSWLQYTLFLASLARCWSDHLHSLMNGAARAISTVTVLHWHRDTLPMLAMFLAMLLLLMSLRIASTICVTLFSVTSIVVTSSIMVAFLYATPVNWIRPGFFVFGFQGVFKGALVLSYAFVGVEMVSFVLEECEMPHKRVPVVIPLSTCLLSVYTFITCTALTLSVQRHDLLTDNHLLLPDWFEHLGLPAARYVLNVGAVCGLSGSLLLAVLAPSRLLATMAHDRFIWLCIGHLGKKTGSPWAAITCTCLVTCIWLMLPPVSLQLCGLSLLLRMLILVTITVHQHFAPVPFGFQTQVANYRQLPQGRQTRRRLLVDENGQGMESHSVCVSAAPSNDTTSRISGASGASSMLFRNIAIMQSKEAANEAQAQEHAFLLDNNKQHSVLQTKSTPIIPKSVSKYPGEGSIDEGTLEDEELKEEDANHSIPSNNHHCGFPHEHNCLRSPCSPVDVLDHNITLHNEHIYERQVPDLPYYSDSLTAAYNHTPINQQAQLNRAIQLLCAFMILATAQTAMFNNMQLLPETVHGLWLLPVYCTLTVLLVLLSVAIARLNTNHRLVQRKSKVGLFPIVSLITIWLILLIIQSADFTTFAQIGSLLIAVTICGVIILWRRGEESRIGTEVEVNALSTNTDNDQTPIVGVTQSDIGSAYSLVQ